MDSPFIERTVVITLSLILVAMVAAMLKGLFDPAVDNQQLLAILGPAFQTIVGTFVGFLGGRVVGKAQAAGAAAVVTAQADEPPTNGKDKPDETSRP